MISFYYKGVLFTKEGSARDYSKDILLLSDWSSEIHNESGIKELIGESTDFSITTHVKISDNLLLIYEINKKEDLFCFYNTAINKFISITYQDLRNIPYAPIKELERKVNRYGKAILRGDISHKHNSLIYPVKHMWTVYKSYIDKQNKFDVINTVKEAELIMSKDIHIETRDQLRQIFRKDEEFER